MVMTTVLADCEVCKKETECKFEDCDRCYERFLDAGGEPDKYDADAMCAHLRCLECGEPPYDI
jgi:hypothetical protein